MLRAQAVWVGFRQTTVEFDRPERVAGETLFLRLPGAGGKEFRRLELLLQMFPGDTPVKVRLLDTGKLVRHPLRAGNVAYLCEQMKELLGEQNVALVGEPSD